jgi:hypothetical protein
MLLWNQGQFVYSVPSADKTTDDPALTNVEMNHPGARYFPISSGNVNVSLGAICRAFVMRFEVPATSPTGTMFTETVWLDPEMFVAVNLSMRVLVFTAVYWVVWAASPYLGLMMGIGVKAMVYLTL